ASTSKLGCRLSAPMRWVPLCEADARAETRSGQALEMPHVGSRVQSSGCKPATVLHLGAKGRHSEAARREVRLHPRCQLPLSRHRAPKDGETVEVVEAVGWRGSG